MDADSNLIRDRNIQSLNTDDANKNGKESCYSKFLKPVHRHSTSLLSRGSGFGNFNGVQYWSYYMLLYGSIRICIENYSKYGFRLDPTQWVFYYFGHNPLPALILSIVIVVPAIISLMIEKGIASNNISEKFGITFQIANIFLIVLLPGVVFYLSNSPFSFGTSGVIAFYSLLFSKMWSYCQTNYWYRKLGKGQLNNNFKQQWPHTENLGITNTQKNDDTIVGKIVQYPDNLTLKDILYFLIAPTLCYELNFPRTPRIRKQYVIMWLLQLILGVGIIWSIFQQFIVPTVSSIDAKDVFTQMDVMKIMETLIIVSVYYNIIFLTYFYITYHSLLNFLGELLRFGDRNFYKDWWNTRNMGEFWSSWNMPVHKWFLRHVYTPMLASGYGLPAASFAVFFISAFFHEYLLSGAILWFRPWSFLAMLLQIPVGGLSRYVQLKFGPSWSKHVVWHMFFFMHPTLALMYYYDYVFYVM